MARILLIDDDVSVRTMLQLTLTHFGHTVIEAGDGREGLRLFPHAKPDLIVTDIVMPEKEGIEVLMELREIRPKVKIIAISGGGRRNAAANYLELATRLGAARVFEKPFTNEALITAINELLATDEMPEDVTANS